MDAHSVTIHWMSKAAINLRAIGHEQTYVIMPPPQYPNCSSASLKEGVNVRIWAMALCRFYPDQCKTVTPLNASRRDWQPINSQCLASLAAFFRRDGDLHWIASHATAAPPDKR
jgi:hypothetical protein